MKLLVIGCGQCGGRIADEFCRLNVRAKVQRGIEITTGVFAVNTDVADLSELAFIRSDYQHRILIGNQKTGGHGVGKINELGAEIAREDSDKVIDAIKTAPQFAETDAFLIVASAAGGTGSGALPTLTQHIKERYITKPVYDLVVLPFKHEEMTEERTIYNTATCIKSAYLVGDAVFLVDNQRYLSKDLSVKENLTKINRSVVEPFYDLLCAGEETKPEYIGGKILDAGDIIQTLVGWTVIGHGTSRLSRFGVRFSGKRDFRHKLKDTNKGVQSLERAISDLSVKCSPTDAKRALYLVSGPPKKINMDLIRGLGAFTKTNASEAVIRSGDYPRGTSSVNVTIILSELANVKKVMEYFSKTINFMDAAKKKWIGTEQEHRAVEDMFKDIPSLLS